MKRSTVCFASIIVLLWLFVGCKPNQQVNWVTITESPDQIHLTPTVSPIPSNPPVISETATPFPTPLLTVTPTPVNDIPTIVLTSTATTVFMPVGSLLIYDEKQIMEQPLPEGEPKILLSKDPTWITWQVSLSPTGKYAVYWFESQAVSEVRLFFTDSQDSQFLANLSENRFEEIVFEWLGSDRYLYLELRRKNNLGLLELPKSYLFDTQISQMMVSDSIKFCRYLVLSPHTLQPATLCPLRDDLNNYIVVEPFGEVWQSDETIFDHLISERELGNQGWAWNLTGNSLAFAKFEPNGSFLGSLLSLHYMSLIDNSLQLLNDGKSDTFNGLSLSPDSQFIAYWGKGLSSLDGTVIMSIFDQKIIWNSRTVTTITPTLWVSWSLDSRFFAVDIPFEGVIIFDVTNNLEIWQREDLFATQLVWK